MFLFKGQEKLSRSFAKAVSWRVLGSIDTFVLGYIFTGSAKAAGGIAATEVATKICLYTAHEQAWGRIKWGHAKPDEQDNEPPAPPPEAGTLPEADAASEPR